jgi:chromatin segregation and condensation protein Rec8/ScpA/Scc1 (kleisin family)
LYLEKKEEIKMNKDYGEILLEAMSTLLETKSRALLEVESSTEEEAITQLSTADPLVNFLPNISYKTTDAVNVAAKELP